MTEEGEQLHLGLDRGRLVVLTVLCHRQEEGGWTARVLHRHEGEIAMCPGNVTYRNLSTGELAQVCDGTLGNADGRFDVLRGDCHPVPN